MDSLRVAVIIGSVREGRFGPTVADWFVAQARQRPDLEIDVVDLVDTPLPDRLGNIGGEQGMRLAAVSPRLAAADAFVIVTAEYNKSFPAALKDLLDWHFTEWQAKPVGFVSYGGVSGGLRAVEHLRLVLTELHAVTLRDTVSFPLYWDRFGPDGLPMEPEGAVKAADVLLEQLDWWGRALRGARAERPYVA
jgi:NAD(P)H-dependent FMN reductase